MNKTRSFHFDHHSHTTFCFLNSSAACNAPWVPFGSSCYMFVQDKSNWFHAAVSKLPINSCVYINHIRFCNIRGVIKKFSAPSSSDYQGMKIWSLLFNIIPLQGIALSSSLFELAYPFQIEVFFLVPTSTRSLPL